MPVARRPALTARRSVVKAPSRDLKNAVTGARVNCFSRKGRGQEKGASGHLTGLGTNRSLGGGLEARPPDPRADAGRPNDRVNREKVGRTAPRVGWLRRGREPAARQGFRGGGEEAGPQ